MPRIRIRQALEVPAKGFSCLPHTMELARQHRRTITQYDCLRATPRRWSFDDRVLVWLSPEQKSAIEKFYAGTGKAMEDALLEDQLEREDQRLYDELRKRLGLGRVPELLPQPRRNAWASEWPPQQGQTASPNPVETIDALVFQLEKEGCSDPVGFAVLAPSRRYASLRWKGDPQLQRQDCNPSKWIDVEHAASALVWGLVDRASAIHGLLIQSGEMRLSHHRVIRLVEAPDPLEMTAALDKALMDLRFPRATHLGG